MQHYVGSYTLAGRETYDFWEGEEWVEGRAADGAREDGCGR